MDNSFCFKSKVRYSEIDAKENLSIPHMINYLQDCTTFHSEKLGVGVETMMEKKRAWILSSWIIEIFDYPKFYDDIVVKTWATGFRGIFGDRNFTIEGSEGKVYVQANSLWVFMDLETGRPGKAPQDMISLYGSGEPLDMEKAPRKMKSVTGAEALEPMKVRRSQIDTNQHMNNCQYVVDALEVARLDKPVKKIRVEYKKSAVYGDVIYPKLAQETDKNTVELCDEAGSIYAIVELSC